MESTRYKFLLDTISSSCMFLVNHAEAHPNLFCCKELKGLRDQISAMISESSSVHENPCETIPPPPPPPPSPPPPASSSSQPRRRRSEMSAVAKFSKFTEEEDAILRKAEEDIISGKYNAMDCAREVAKLVNHLPNSIYHRMRKLRLDSTGTASVATKEDRQDDREAAPRRKRGFTGTYGSASDSDGDSSDSEAPRKKKHRRPHRHFYTQSENELVLRCANSILEGTTTLKEVVRTLAVQMGVSESAIQTKLTKLMRKTAETVRRRRPRGKYTPPLSQRLGASPITVSPSSAYIQAEEASDSDTVSGSMVDRALRSDDGSSDQGADAQQHQQQPSTLSIEDLLADIIPADSSDAFGIPSDWL